MFAEKLARYVLLALPIAMLVLSIPLALNLVPRNHIYGIRTERALSSVSEWTAANRVGGSALAIGSILAIAVVAAMQARKGMTPVSILLQAGAFTIFTAAALIVAMVLS